MKARIRHVKEVLRTTLWLVPGVMALASAGMAYGALALDRHHPGLLPSLLQFAAGPDAAHSLLTTLAGSTLGVVGVTFSVTMVALAMASQQLGPRLLREFLRDRTSHVVLGVFVATFLYSLLVLQAVEEDVPHLSLLLAMLLAVVALGTLLYFVHHVAHSVQADEVIDAVSRELERHIDRMYPERIGEEPARGKRHDVDPPPDAFVLRARRLGYLQSIEESRILQLAERHGLVIDLLRRPGDFVSEGAPLLRAWPKRNLPEAFEREVRRVVFVGASRTAEQDVEFSLDQLVEVATRSLSPGINDPFTAMRCIDRIGSSLCRLCTRRFPSPYREDEDGELRVIARRPTFEGMVDAAFNQIRQYGKRSPGVVIRMLEAMELVASCAGPHRELRAPVLRHAKRLVDDAHAERHSKADLEDIDRRYKDFLAALEEAKDNPGQKPEAPRKRDDAFRRPRRGGRTGGGGRREPGVRADASRRGGSRASASSPPR